MISTLVRSLPGLDPPCSDHALFEDHLDTRIGKYKDNRMKNDL